MTQSHLFRKKSRRRPSSHDSNPGLRMGNLLALSLVASSNFPSSLAFSPSATSTWTPTQSLKYQSPGLGLRSLGTKKLKLHALPSPNHHDSTSPATTTTSTTTGNAIKRRSLSSALSSSVGGSWSMPRQQRKRREEESKDYQWNKQNLAIALPALMGLLADPVLSMVDTAFVGRIGAIDLAALGVCTSIFHMAFSIFRASTVATTSLVGSAKSEQEARQITKISLSMAGILGSIVMFSLRLGGPKLLHTMGVPASSPLYQPACDYLFARCWAAPAVVASTYQSMYGWRTKPIYFVL